ncbi:hypothetical protein HQ520_00150, partial [bacterium]|nr:hypothetical protein [bacterium]
VYAGPGLTGRYLLFLAWMMANLVLWAAGLSEIFGRRRPHILIVAFTAKAIWIGVLFLLCRQVGISGLRNFLAFLLGLNTPFLLMFLKALGQAVAQGMAEIQEKPAKSGRAHSDSTEERH